MKPKPVLGQTIYSLNVGNVARNMEQKLTPVVVKKVGRKYFTAGEPNGSWSDHEYHIDTWMERCCGSPTSWLYETEQEWLDKKEKQEAIDFVKDRCNHWVIRDIPLEKLRAIQSIKAFFKAELPVIPVIA